MKLLMNAHFPMLDPLLSPSNQSTVFEILFWSICYVLYSCTVSHLVRFLYRKLPIWTTAKTFEGVMCGNGRDDAVILTLMAIHHAASCALMYTGMKRNDTDLWRHGYLMESGLEVGDIVAVLFKLYPYKWDGVKPEIKVGLMFHHVPGLALCTFIMESGLYANEHMQAIIFWLLGAAAVNCAACIFGYCLDVKTQMWPVAVNYNACTLFFAFCRFYMFPKESLALLADIANDDSLNGSLVHKLLILGALALTLFNLAIIAEVIPKSIYYMQCAIRCEVPRQTVPPSRDSILGARGRRSSLKIAIDTMSKAQRSSSLSAIVMLDPTEHLLGASGSSSSTYTRGDVVYNDNLDDLSEEDRNALRRTLTTLSQKKEDILK